MAFRREMFRNFELKKVAFLRGARCSTAFCGLVLAFAATSFSPNLAFSQVEKPQDVAQNAPLSMKRIFASGEFSERGVDARWAPSGAAFVKRVASTEPCGGRDVVLENPSDGTQTTILRASELIPRDPKTNVALPDAQPLNVEEYAISDDSNLVLIYTNSKRVWRRNTRGDYWIRDRKNDVFRKLGGDFAAPSSLQFAKISPDGTRVAYVCANNVYVEEILSGKTLQITFDGDENIINGTFDWVYEEEFDCRDGFRWSPDGKRIAFWRLDSSREPAFVMLDGVGLSRDGGATRVAQVNGDFQTLYDDATPQAAKSDADDKTSKRLDSYPTLVSFKYPRVGCENATAAIGIATLPELGAETFDAKLGTKFVDFNDTEEFYLPGMEWFSGRRGPIVQKTPRSQRRCDFYEIDAETATPTLLFSDVDPTAWQTVYSLYPLKDGDRFLRISEKDGFRRIYLTSFSDVETLLPLTPPNADAIDFVAFDYDANGCENGVYYYASPESGTRRFLYRASLDGAQNERVELESDAAFGYYTWNISADSSWAICRRSAFGVPSRIDLATLDGAKAQVVKTLEDNAALREKLAQENFGPSESFTVEIDKAFDFETQNASADLSSEKVSLDGWAILPPDWNADDAKRYPALIYVYGEPAGQTVLDSWGGSTYIYHRAIAERGCVVLSFDGRGTPAPKGREWRKCVYQKLGAVGRSDQAAALRRFLETSPIGKKIDVNRIGVWGWSGGGTSTLNLLFNYPDLYACGIAIAPVADYRNYDTIYQERYSGLIDEAPESYELGSPIGYAAGLKGALLLIHGSGDDNCHYQTSEALVNKLIALGKDFDAFVYPYRSHGIFEGAGTTLHLREKTMKFWERNLFAPNETK